MILITGASGHLGKLVINNLIEHVSAKHIIGMVRGKAEALELQNKGIEARIGDYDNTDSLDSAMKGVEKVLLISTNNEERRLTQHQNVVAAAIKNDISYIAYTSRLVKDQDSSRNNLMEGHFKTEKMIKKSGLNYMIFRNALYMDVIPLFVGGKSVFKNGINLPAENGEVSYVLRSDLAEAIAIKISGDDWNNKTIELANTKSWSFNDVSAILGKGISYNKIKRSQYIDTLIKKGFDAIVASRYADFMSEIKDGYLQKTNDSLKNILNREPISLEKGLKPLFK